MIISASRRTDIPGYYSDWFLNRLKEGYVITRNPMNRAQLRQVILTPEVIDCIVFWTKDPENMMEKLPTIDSMGYRYYFQFTLTPYNNEIERNLRDKKDIICTFLRLSEIIGKDRILWRYDPILINEHLSLAYHWKEFEDLCRKLQGYTDICTISFVDLYSKLNKRVKEKLIKEVSEEQMHQLASDFSEIAKSNGIELRACCEIIDLSMFGIKPVSCIDQDIIAKICRHEIEIKRDKNQRSGCGCVQSVDIGAYNTCKNGCIYCYANHSDTTINNNFVKHNPMSDILIE